MMIWIKLVLILKSLSSFQIISSIDKHNMYGTVFFQLFSKPMNRTRFFPLSHSFCHLHCIYFSHFWKNNKSLLSFIPISTLLFADNRLLISQERIYEKSNANLFCSYNIILSLFNQFSLVIEHNKLEVFYFSRLTKEIHFLLLDLRPLKDLLVYSKYIDIWRYLGFFFSKKTSFWHYIHHHANKALFTVKDMKILGNLNRGLSPTYIWLLYRIYILPIILYGFQLWYFKGAPLFQLLKELKKMQRKAVL